MRKLIMLTTALFPCAVLAADLATNETPVYHSKTELMLRKSKDNFFSLAPYEQNYIMETFSNGNFDMQDGKEKKHDEIKFQISLGLPIWRGILGENSLLGASYTQRSWFQLSNTIESSPFRETNYEPQLFLAWSTKYDLPWGWTLNDIETGFNHESNGRSDQFERSRSWNRLYARVSAHKDNWMVEFKPWWRIPEKADDDDNPDITAYRGHYDLTVGYKYDEHQVKLTGHYNLKSGKGGVLANYSYPITKQVRFYVQYYGGYGESLIDYNRRIHRIGLGISLNDVF
ncbi:phospholipase A [Pasteurellaceae bacterium HPA106]|uniref:phospholipase A n=1 Tax=Spirabiliibacterium pneumoniae TaxID=221400 RepID=UPI001AAD14BE|nr:phospholipase A [Spirabiliibacterium pneumoniae]MBE2896933.1 phospholipase A [Spirabiliibacterium pneumoniae]